MGLSNIYNDDINLPYKEYYALPATGFKVTVIQKSEEYTPGDLVGFAENYFEMKPSSLIAYTKYSLQDINVENFAVYDSARVFSISFNETQSINLTMSKQGFIRGLNLETSYQPELCENGYFPYHKNFKEHKGTNIVYLPQKYYAAATKTAKAELAAKEIYTLRDDRHFLAIGEATNSILPDGKAVKEMLDYLQKLENNYLQLFYGTTEIHYDTLVFWYKPNTSAFQREMLFRFSNASGVSGLTNNNAYPVYIELEASNVQQVKALEERTKVIRIKTKANKGLAYAIPNLCKVVVRDDVETLFQSTFNVTQLGTIAILPIDYFFNHTRVEYFPCTGSIKQITNDFGTK
jgi:hypothetical protein